LSYLLNPNDILLTEGGDPDKLGRGGIWKGEITPCIHQNHVFRVRITNNHFLPEYLSALLGSRYGKNYFFKEAKQTTGIATINRTQLRAFPVLFAPFDLQQKFTNFQKQLDRQKSLAEKGLVYLDTLFSALQQRAFSGRL
jgi:type I restriction enzyme S subunit